MDPLVIVFGLGVGVLVGLTGIGGGSLMTPLLVIVIGTKPVVAVGTDIAYGAITKTLGGWRHFRSGTVDMGLSKWLAFGSVPASVLGVVAVDNIEALHDKGLLWGVAFALLFTAFATLARALFVREPKERHSVPIEGRVKVGAVALGALLGFILGVTSVGSGALVGLALILVFKLTPHRVVGTDVFHAALMLWAAGIAHVIAGNIDYGLMATILIGSLPGVWIGEHLARRIPAAALRPGLGCVMLGSGLGVLTKVGADIPAWVIVGAPTLVAIAAYALYRSRAVPAAAPSTP
jgi:uncharacterized membrane protein YfcA